ncbi:hypothetical protein DSO57_1031750 [Entomophthora muscae]|uniref:Uncharacterized protein n=1 Tax=Entomophthora muscae TaxID=34485 RepID=A0ACC2UAJ2_9FUNG|nr:hypothetical protein DSO57_1031750 [Entomophthora muscae]
MGESKRRFWEREDGTITANAVIVYFLGRHSPTQAQSWWDALQPAPSSPVPVVPLASREERTAWVIVYAFGTFMAVRDGKLMQHTISSTRVSSVRDDL